MKLIKCPDITCDRSGPLFCDRRPSGKPCFNVKSSPCVPSYPVDGRLSVSLGPSTVLRCLSTLLDTLGLTFSSVFSHSLSARELVLLALRCVNIHHTRSQSVLISRSVGSIFSLLRVTAERNSMNFSVSSCLILGYVPVTDRFPPLLLGIQGRIQIIQELTDHSYSSVSNAVSRAVRRSRTTITILRPSAAVTAGMGIVIVVSPSIPAPACPPAAAGTVGLRAPGAVAWVEPGAYC